MKKIRIGIIGYGGIAQGVHVYGYSSCEDISEITAVCDIKPSALAEAKEKHRLDDSCLFSDYKKLIDSGLVDAVDICTPNYVHCEIAIYAAEHGLPFSVEKPIGVNLADARRLEETIERTGVKSFVCFSWRYTQYTRCMRDIVKNGSLGKLYHIYIRCIKNSGLWEGRRLEWRFDKNKAGTGVLGDLGSHMVDITRFMGEEFASVSATTGIYITERCREESDEVAKVTTDDWCNIIAMTESGTPVTIAVSRCATTIDNLIEVEVMGENGRMKYSYNNGEQDLRVCIGELDMQSKGTHSIIPSSKYDAVQSRSFVNMLLGKEDEYTSHFVEGIACQKVLEACEISAKTGSSVKICEL